MEKQTRWNFQPLGKYNGQDTEPEIKLLPRIAVASSQCESPLPGLMECKIVFYQVAG